MSRNDNELKCPKCNSSDLDRNLWICLDCGWRGKKKELSSDRKPESFWSLSKPLKNYPASLLTLYLVGAAWCIWISSDSEYFAIAGFCFMSAFLGFIRMREGKNIILLVGFILNFSLGLLMTLNFAGLF